MRPFIKRSAGFWILAVIGFWIFPPISIFLLSTKKGSDSISQKLKGFKFSLIRSYLKKLKIFWISTGIAMVIIFIANAINKNDLKPILNDFLKNGVVSFSFKEKAAGVGILDREIG